MKNKGQKVIGQIAAAFEADLKVTAVKAAMRDLAGGGNSIGKIEGKYLVCNAKFQPHRKGGWVMTENIEFKVFDQKSLRRFRAHSE